MALIPEDEDGEFLENYEPTHSLWKLVEQYVPVADLPEIKRILGEGLVDLNLEMHKEVETWLDMWRSMMSENSSPSEECISHTTLTEAPAIKELLKEEIRLLLLNIREKAGEQGRDENKVFQNYNPNVVNFVMENKKPVKHSRRISSARCSPDGLRFPSRPQSASEKEEERPLSRISASFICEDDTETIKDKLNVIQIDDVVAHMKSVLQEECHSLKKDISILQEHLEDAHRSKCQIRGPRQEPSIAELKEERKIIKRDLESLLSAPSVALLHKVPHCRAPLMVARFPTSLQQSLPPSSVLGLSQNSFQLKCPSPASTLHLTKDISLTGGSLNCLSGPSQNNSKKEADTHMPISEEQILFSDKQPISSVASSILSEKQLRQPWGQPISKSMQYPHIDSLLPVEDQLEQEVTSSLTKAIAGTENKDVSKAEWKVKAVPAIFTVTLDAEAASSFSGKACAPSPPLVERPADRAQPGPRRTRLLQTHSLSSIT
ncbi:coiled-coil domain-containing protein 24 [Erpetoichthys calabaricus]|uniref:coiled-coil domain-containing protein 24 n=1 Tax=Erpetoichthys calabaricus TaxID=27687 RepID=UPI00223487B6|nr:coiled-coil domain-containing protein 24 [Erpetoichthys calabaricus]XP_028667113.2 coiled-coil domain-containing protein 24 [Erpetoichthys calabaricus]XP_028667114.2 coiled-coil domain-containing protein 24 [Erpetoichthys calabaricus]